MVLGDRDEEGGVIALRRATSADVPAITALVREAYTPWVAVMGREPGPMGFDYAQGVERTIIDLHEVDGALAALIQMRVADDHLDIINVAVAPSVQRRGIARALMAHAEDVARANGLGEARLFTNKLMESNQSFYARLGYIVEREAEFRGGIVVHMTKRLAVIPGRA